MTNPPFYQRCQKEDTPEYMYSIPGFDPCYPLDFSQVQTIEFLINCRTFDSTNTANPTSENVGYEYRDVITPAVAPIFDYQAVNQANKYKLY